MEEKMLFLGYKAVILSSPFLGVSSFSLTLQVCLFCFLFTQAVLFSTTFSWEGGFCFSLLLISHVLDYFFVSNQRLEAKTRVFLGDGGWELSSFPWLKVRTELRVTATLIPLLCVLLLMSWGRASLGS